MKSPALLLALLVSASAFADSTLEVAITTPAKKVTLSVEVEPVAALPVRYQWYKNNLGIAGATNPTLELTLSSEAEYGTYYVVVRNEAGAATSDKAIIRKAVVKPASAKVKAEPQP